jgi:hypothetical protein
MEVLWLTPAAWWGVAALAIPVAIHLLTRQHTRRIPFPTLRFLHATRLAALRRRSIHDWPLLLIRAAILAAAVAALASPVFVSRARTAEWQTRTALAVVVAPSGAGVADQSGFAGETRASFTSAVFEPSTHLADGLRDAAHWLARQPPAAREVVVVGDLREGSLEEADLALLPATVGLRFSPMPIPVGPRTSTLHFPLGTATLSDDRTRVVYRSAGLKPGPTPAADFIGIRAAPADTAFAQAAREAVLARGVRVDRGGTRRVLVVFEGGDTRDLQLKRPAEPVWMREALARMRGMSGGQHGDTLVVETGQPARGIETAHAIERVVEAAFAEDLGMLEPRRIPASTLANWSRPPRPDTNAPVSDEGDRRWLWALTLALIGIEGLVRRSSEQGVRQAPPIEEQRVA